MDLDKITTENGTVRKNYVTVKGCMLPKKYIELRNEFENYEVNEDDIWICTYPKCGTTWTQEMVWLIANNLDFERAKRSLEERVPFLEFPIIFDLHNVDKNSKLVFSDGILNSANLVKNNGFVKTHFPVPLLPREIREGYKKPKIIYVTRDPKDVCVSYYHHSVILHNFTGTFEEYCELFLAGKVLFGSYWDNVLSFWKLRNQPNILFLRYEDMKRDLKHVIKKVADFLDRSLNEQEIDKLFQHLSFESMSKNPAVNKSERVEQIKKFYNRLSDGKFIRKGVVGDHKTVMSTEMIQKFDSWIQKNIAGTDYVM